MLFPARQEGNLITTHRGWGSWTLASISSYESRWFQITIIIMVATNFDVFKGKYCRFVETKSLHKLCFVYKYIKLYLTRCVYMKYAQNFFFSFSWYWMRSICYILFNNWRRLSRLSFIHVPVKLEILCAELWCNFLGGGGIWSPFWPGEGGIWTKIFQKFKCPGGCPGGMLKLRFDWYISSIDFDKVRLIERSIWYPSSCVWSKAMHLKWKLLLYEYRLAHLSNKKSPSITRENYWMQNTWKYGWESYEDYKQQN